MAKKEKSSKTPKVLKTNKKGKNSYYDLTLYSNCRSHKGVAVGLGAAFVVAAGSVGGYFLYKALTKPDLTKAAIEYKEDKDGYTVTGISNEDKSLITSITVPNTYNGKPVISINEGALSGCSNLEEITLPFIGASADATGKEGLFGYVFGNEMSEGAGAYTYQIYVDEESTNALDYQEYQAIIPQDLNYVTINGGNKISSGAFSNCKYIQSIEIKDNDASEIGEYAFYYCSSLYEFDIPSTVKDIKYKAFSRNYVLREVELPTTVNSLGEETYSNCISLGKVTIPSSVTKIDTKCFYNMQGGAILVEDTEKPSGWAEDWAPKEVSVCYGLDNIIYADNYLIAVCEDSNNSEYAHLLQWTGKWQVSDINIPDKIVTSKGTYPIKVIGANLFADNTNIKTITIGKYVETIGANAFYNCNKLKSFTFDNTEKGDGEGAIDTPLKYIGVSAFEKDALLEGCMIEGKFVSGVRIPKNVETIENRAFNGCSRIARIQIPENINRIGDYAFENCERLMEGYEKHTMEVKMGPDEDPTPVTNERAVVIHKNINYLGEGAFKNCFRLQDDGATTLLYPMFAVENEAGIDGYKEHVFENCGVRTTDGIHSRKIRINFDLGTQPDGAKTFGDYSFSNCYMNYFSVRNENLNYVGDHAFYNAYPNMPAGVKICHNVTSIGDYAFYNWNTVGGITLEDTTEKPSQLTSIGQYAFYNCNNALFKSLIIPDKVETIGRYAFASCSKIEHLELPKNDNYTQVSYCCFSGCTNLGRYSGDNDLIIPTNVTDLDSGCFQNCTNLVNVTVGNDSNHLSPLTRVSWSIFSGCTALRKVDWDLSNVTSFSSNIFNGCSSLTEDETTSLKTTSITSSMYANCTSLTSVTIKSHFTSISENAFKGCTNLATVAFEERTTSISIGRSTFQDCEKLVNIGTNIENNYQLPEKVTSFGDYAFSGCKNLGKGDSHFQLPINKKKSLTFGSNVFEDWTSEQTIWFTQANISGSDSDSITIYGNIKLVPTNVENQYKVDTSHAASVLSIGSTEVIFEKVA